MSSSSTIIGIDLGGTKTAIARFDATTWEREEMQRLPTHAKRGVSHVIDDIVALVLKLKRENTIGVGIGIPGLVQQPEGIVLTLPNIPGEENVPIKQMLTDKIGLPVAVDNDANCFALAEAREGAGKGHRVVVGITMGTGVGGGIVIDGNLFQGAHGYAAEIGHMLLKPGEPPYPTSDARGDVEQFISGTAMGKRCAHALKPEEYFEGEVSAFLRAEVFQEVAWMCVNLIHLVDPGIVIFGGSAGRALKSHLGEINDELTQWLLPGTPVPELAVATLPDAPLRGAGMLVG